VDLGIVDRVALVTGGGRGLGAEIARVLLMEGCRVVVTSRSKDTLEKFKNGVSKDLQESLSLVVSDLSTSNIDCLVKDIFELVPQIDILVNNAGDTLGVVDPICGEDSWKKVMDLNAMLPIALNEQFIPKMIEQGWGRIVNITSVAGQENSGPVPFSTAKAALAAYSRSMGRVLAGEPADLVMSAVFPGVVATEGGHWDLILKTDPARAQRYLDERVPAKRFGTEREVANTVAFYCSALVSFSHGAIIPVDGGHAKHYLYQNYMD